MQKTKRNKEIVKSVNLEKEYTLPEAIAILKDQSKVKFVESLDCAIRPVSYTHLRAHETVLDLVCRLLLEKKKTTKSTKHTRPPNLKYTKKETH